MQSSRLLPPPPGELGLDSLGLNEEPGASEEFTPLDPPVANCVGSCGDGWAI